MSEESLIAKIKKNRLVSEFLEPKSLMQFAKYLVTGVLAAVTEYGLFILLKNYVGLWYMFANIPAYFAGFWISFLLNRFWSFNSKENFKKQLLQYFALFSINLCVQSILLYLLTGPAGIPSSISKIFVMGLIVLWNFIIFKKIIYKN
ncbi:MAG TPA: GtrA family protein [Clostridia bacterium]|nr:GtrA family protein [Clostridia bacterium]